MQAVENKILDQVMAGFFVTTNICDSNIVCLNAANILTDALFYNEDLFCKSMHSRNLFVNSRAIDIIKADEWDEIFGEHCSKTLLNEYEREFDDRLLSLNKDLPKKDKPKGLFGKLLSMWSVSLCSLASMGSGNANDEGGLLGMNLFE